jgi:enoyl-CoA hydratase/carnithine racemase
VGRIIGPDRMTEMMLTGRRYGAEDGLRLGLSHYLVETGEGLSKALELAGDIASNATLVNYLIIQGISRIDDMSRADGLFTESLSAALSQTGADAQEGLRAFLEKRKPRFG